MTINQFVNLLKKVNQDYRIALFTHPIRLFEPLMTVSTDNERSSFALHGDVTFNMLQLDDEVKKQISDHYYNITVENLIKDLKLNKAGKVPIYVATYIDQYTFLEIENIVPNHYSKTIQVITK